MTRKNTTIAVFVAVAVLALSAMAYAGPHRGQGMGRGYCGQGYHALTQEQQEKADALSQKFFADTQPLRQQMYAKNAELEALLANGEKDQKRIDTVIAELNALHSDFFKKRVEFRQKIADETGIRYPMGRGMGMMGGAGCPGGGRGGDCPGFGGGNCYGQSDN
ncbi:zinc resistance-associated protein [Desulfobaculum xiamenense]|uniref:Zinc resistance-associated protein n=1 Tax=Desulfobaculum xiamenense TaxID=995050 RepID=A0A846QUV0_9BACT|nr:periplasmic heavy metal sensor [Desulfobaculum xiamenense]NJB68419.1 zinc resistance-associated protein [Desulfobaculum xiamenense]